MRIPSVSLVLSLVAAAVLIGCEHAEYDKAVSWNGSSKSSSSSSSSSSTSTSSSSGSTAGDAVSFSALNWSFGGLDGSGASQSGVVLSNLKCSKSGMSFHYDKDLSAWGRSKTQTSDFACFFVQRSDGKWVGGKFDWISTSRTTRGFENIYGRYKGWSLSGVPNPCNAAFLILNHDGKRRSNVIRGTWSR